MKIYLIKQSFFLFVILASISSFAIKQVDYNQWFYNKTMRFDYIHAGSNKLEFVFLDELIEEGIWAGSTKNLIDTFKYGQYRFEILDSISEELIYAYGLSTLFSEWQTTTEATTTNKAFSETIRFPFPKKTVKLIYYSRERSGIFVKKQEFYLNPINFDIRREKKENYKINALLNSGNPTNCIDIVIIPDGYTLKEMSKFKKDCQFVMDAMFNCAPYKEMKGKFNVNAIEAASMESGPDIPCSNKWSNTVIDSRFCSLASDRYLMSLANKNIHNVAGLVPYDQIIILANSKVYGGGGIYNFYATCSSDNEYRKYVITHEFGHTFGGLADEYFDSEVPYNEMYNLEVEPWEPNITTLVNFEAKWKNMLDKETPIPTPAKKSYLYGIGVYEGGGYASKGIYRPKNECSMRTISYNNFCPVCQNAIIQMIKFQTE